MTLFTRWTLTLSLGLAAILSGPTITWPIEDAIIAIVNDEVISLKDLRDYVHSTYISLVAEGLDNAQLQAVMRDMETNGIHKLIEDKLIISKANKIGLEVREALVDERIVSMKQRYGSEQNLIDALIKNGATITDLRNKIRDQLKIKYIIDREVKSRIYVNPQEVTDYYENNKTSFSQDERVHLESIFIAYGLDKTAALAQANDILAQAREGKDFESLSKQYSQSPSIGTVERGQLLPQIEQTIFDLALGEISSLVEADNGIYIFKLISKRPSEVIRLEKVKESIYATLSKDKFKTRFIQWLEGLKKNAYIEIKP